MEDEKTEVPSDELPPEQPLAAVIVVKRIDEDGTITPEVTFQGDIRPTEVQTLLETGVLRWRQQIGLR